MNQRVVKTEDLWKDIQNLSIKPTQKLIQTKDYYDLNRPQIKVN